MAINIGEKAQAEAKLAMSDNQIKRAKLGKGMFGEKIPNKVILEMTREGWKHKLDATQTLNRLKKNQHTDESQ